MTNSGFFVGSIPLIDEKVFGDKKEHEYKGRFYDGFAVLKKSSIMHFNDPTNLVLLYPTMSVVKGELAETAMLYTGVTDRDNINIRDIALIFGEIINPSISISKLVKYW